MKRPSMEDWLREAKARPDAPECGMYLFHNGVVRSAPKAVVRHGAERKADVEGMLFSYDRDKLAAAIARAEAMPGIFHIRVWLNEGELSVGDDIMLVLVGGDIRPHVIDALQSLVGEIKNECVREEELY
ncbi:MAG: molybdenum cofactor biosynthesis protein MoaE [Oscillospiraceae bacterium]|nr:molybdenum cofactor biosynthesis protein MoaE [Oscillospiraceae bacterium]